MPEGSLRPVSAIDVVVCPDFAGPLPHVFEARTLLFLGSWLEHEGASREWPLHVVCIGEPPPSVRVLAERCGATLSVHAELSGLGNRIMNRLHGLDIESRTGRILMVDCDAVVLRDLAPVAELGECFAAVVGPRNPLPAPLWQEIFDVAGVKMPPERLQPWVLSAEGRIPAEEMRGTLREAMPPYFQAAVYLVPAGSNLRAHWERIQGLLSERFAGRAKPYDRMWKKTQCALSVCVALLAEEGIPWRTLPLSMNVLDLMIAAGDVCYEDVQIFHAGTIFRRGPKDAPLDPRREIQLYHDYQFPRFYPDPSTPTADSARRLCDRLQELTERHVAPAYGRGR